MKNKLYKHILTLASVICTTALTVNAQKITSIDPSTGPLNGTTVTLKGTDLTKSTPVGVFLIDPASPKKPIGTSTVSYTDSSYTFIAPAQKSGTYSVYLELNTNQQKVNAPSFTYMPPELTNIYPDSSSVKGKDTVTITGKYFSGASYVNFGTAGNTPITTSDTIITVAVPALKSGIVDVQVEAQSVLSKVNQASKFTYVSDKPDSMYTVSLKNLTGMGDAYKVYVLGYSTGSQKMLTLNAADSTGEFTSMPTSPDSGYVQSFELGKEITKIKLSNKNPIVGARIYFFVADTSVTYADSSNKTTNHNLGFKYKASGTQVFQVDNPPQKNYPQYSYIEATFKTDQGLYIDISTVDGFFFPVSLIAQDKKGNELDRIGQSKGVSAHQVVSAYQPFLDKLKLGGEETRYYDSLAYPINNDLTALLNPGLYLENNTSGLDTVFDVALTSLFTDSDLKMNIWQNGTNKFQAYYDVTPESGVTFPGTTNKHSALKFTSSGQKTLYVFNPVGFSVVSYNDGSKWKPIYGKIKNKVLTFKSPLPLNVGLTVGMYVNSGGGSTDGKTYIKEITKKNNKIVSVTLSTADDYSSYFQYKFAKAPKNYYYSSGQTAFAGIGLFADGSFRYSDKNIQTVVNGIENQISTALNRGVAVVKFSGSKGKGHTTKNWAVETGWYPKGQPQNYFSYFMHTAKNKKTNGVHIFSLPQDSVKSARNEYMAKAYGFSYDENPNPLGGYKGPQVPSEFPGVYPKGTTKLKLELGPWKLP